MTWVSKLFQQHTMKLTQDFTTTQSLNISTYNQLKISSKINTLDLQDIAMVWQTFNTFLWSFRILIGFYISIATETVIYMTLVISGISSEIPGCFTG